MSDIRYSTLSVVSSSLNFVDGIIDYMHAVLERATKWLMRAWFKSENHTQPFYLDQSVNQTDRILMQQHPPSEFSQAPRFISEHESYWRLQSYETVLLSSSVDWLFAIGVFPSLCSSTLFTFSCKTPCPMHKRNSVTTITIQIRC